MPEYEHVRKVVRECLQNTVGRTPGDDVHLFDEQLLDSFEMLNFLMFLEKRLGIKYLSGDMTMNNFKTINAITDVSVAKLEDQH